MSVFSSNANGTGRDLSFKSTSWLKKTMNAMFHIFGDLLVTIRIRER